MSMKNPTNVALSERNTAAAFEIKATAAEREGDIVRAVECRMCATMAKAQAERLEEAA